MTRPVRGEVWLADLDPVRGHEQGGRRPVLVVSVDAFNRGPAGLAFVVPVTSRDKQIPYHVAVHPPEGGLKQPSFAKCEDLRSVSTERFILRYGDVSEDTMRSVETRLRLLLGF